MPLTTRKGIARRFVEAVGNLVRRRRPVSDESYEVPDAATVRRAKSAAASTSNKAAGTGVKKAPATKRRSKKRGKRR